MQNILFSQISLEDLKAAISEVVKAEVERLNLHKPEPSAEYISRKESARILGITLPTLNDWSKRGIIPSYRIESRVRYKKAEVEDSLRRVQTIKHSRR
jgi:excisionase family DNA binding protein